LALQCYCFGRNAAVVDGDSPYCKRFGGTFDYDKLYPFGSEIVFIPSEVAGDDALQFEPVGKCGIFLGCGINSFCVWNGAYLVSHVSEFADSNYHTGRRESDNKFITVQMVRDVKRPDNLKEGNFRFPLVAHHDQAFNAPEGWNDCWWGIDGDPEPPIVTKTTTRESSDQDDLLRIHTSHLQATYP
jgi:hypothetical protein